MVYRYSEIWAKPPGSTDESKVVVESGLRELAFDFKAGEHYELTLIAPADQELQPRLPQTTSVPGW